MWRLIRIEADDLCAFRTLDYSPVQGVTTLVFGDNRNNESQRSNGAGKSALLECIAVGLTGSPLRKIRSEEIINDAAEVCRIRLSLANDTEREELFIERRIPRKGASTVICTLCRDGKAVTTDEAVQPSVEAYNRYILDKIGITREELLNNFILSKYRYEDFLSSSDTKKKEIINRFSNGILVDEAIGKVDEDLTPLLALQQEAGLKLAGLDGRVEMLQEQIRAEENAVAERGRSREEKITELETAVAAKRERIRALRESAGGYGKRQEELDAADRELQTMENGDGPLESCLECISAVCRSLPGVTPTDWNRVAADKKEERKGLERQYEEYKASLQNAGRLLEESRKALDTFRTGHAEFRKRYGEESVAAERKIRELDGRLRELSLRLEGLRKSRHTLSAAIDALTLRLAGKIACPACGHEFLVAEPDFDIGTGNRELAERKVRFGQLEEQMTETRENGTEVERLRDRTRTDRRRLDEMLNDRERELQRHERAVREATRNMEEAEHALRRISGRINALEEETDGIRRKAFDEVFGLLDERNAALERETRTAREEIRAAESAIGTLQETIREIRDTAVTDPAASLRESLAQARRNAVKAAAAKTDIDGKVRRLEVQKERFVQFKTYLANTKIEALGHLTNEFLEDIGSDIRIRFDGYTRLKNGRVREKISISLLREGIDCGSFGKFSAGEAARVNLATILAMQGLVNAGCGVGKGLDLLVLDEILEAVDEAGLASMFGALNSLKGTTLVVSHGNIAESYPHRLVIVKENGESRIGE